jgi:hypothetical protein
MRWVPRISTVSRPEQEARGFHRNEGFFTYFRWVTPTLAFFDKSRRLNEIRRLSDYKPLRMSAARARFTPMTLLFTLALCSVLIGGCAGKRQTEPPPDEALRAAIEENIQDETRRAELLANSERFSQILEDLLTATLTRRTKSSTSFCSTTTRTVRPSNGPSSATTRSVRH